MKKITTLFKTKLLAVVVLAMAQGCIPTTPVGGNPTPNPNSQITYKQFNQSLVDSIPGNQTITINFDDLKPIELQLWRTGTIMLTDRLINFIHDTTTYFLLNRTTGYGLSLNTIVNANSFEWSSGYSYYYDSFHVLLTNGHETPGQSCLHADIFNGTGSSVKWSVPTSQTFYVAFKAPLISNPSKYAYGWLQLKSSSYNSSGLDRLISLQLIDGAIETNVGETYTGNH